ncbi:putative MFS multidrug transporter [Aureobasidium pullulans]|nr:putative MFS multidrug transporter [Aureobasidium pullulans]
MQHNPDLKAELREPSDTDSKVNGNNYLEKLETGGLAPWSTHIAGDAANLTPEHRDYLLKRHGTLELDPMPGFGDADPLNWQTWKKTVNLLLVAFHAMMSTFTAAAIIPAYFNIHEDLGCSIQRASYLTSLQIAILGGAPLFWRPLSVRYGRRPIWLISTICSLVCNIGCAYSHSYASMAACRALVAFFISPAGAIGSGVVGETFFKRERGKYMGIWTLMVTLGVPLGGFTMGFVANNVGYRWIYYILAMINGAQFILYIFFGPETRYLRQGVEHRGSDLKQEYWSFRRIDPTPLRAWDFIQPLTMGRHATVMIPAAAYSMVFLLTSILVTVEIPQLFQEKFEFNAQQIGYQFASIIIGAIIGEQLGGVLSDSWMKRGALKMSAGHRPQPEYRLWLSYAGFLLGIVGYIVFLIQTEDITKWNVTPLIGAAIAAVGNQIVTTVLITYAVDCHQEEAASIGVFITFVRQIWGFIGPFWFPQMFESIGLKASAGVGTALMIGVSVVPTIYLHFRGRSRRTSDE